MCEEETIQKIVAGCDEAGRGCLAGPVVAAAVILPKKHTLDSLRDSKKLSEKQREELVPKIKETAIAYSVAFIDQKRIDEINILNASIEAMHLAVSELSVTPEFLIIDGNRFKPYPNIEHKCIVKGDDKCQSIAAASILAKVARDEFMKEIHQQFSEYNWQKNKGYPTKEHKLAIKNFGTTSFHRKTFNFKL